MFLLQSLIDIAAHFDNDKANHQVPKFLDSMIKFIVLSY